MRERHIDPEDLLQVLDQYGKLPWRDALAVHLHFLERCPVCSRRVLDYFGFETLGEIAAFPDPVGELYRRHHVRLGEAALSFFEGLPAAERLAKARAEPALHRREVVEALAARCRPLWCREPAAAREWAELMLAVAEGVAAHPDSRVADEILARAWAYLGNSHRILADLRQAEACFRQARAFLDRGWVDEEPVAEVRALEASAMLALRRFPEAKAAVEEAIELYGLCWEHHLQGKELLTSAKIRLDSGEPEAALRELRKAVPLLDAQEEPRLAWVVAGIELHLLCELSRFAAARALLPEARRLAAEHAGACDRLRVRWCEGRIAAGEGDAGEAEAALAEVRSGFTAEGNAYDAALVSLDLALLFLGAGRPAEVRELAAQMVPLFDAQGVPSAVLAAVLLYARAAEEERATAEWVRALAGFLTEARHGAAVSFSPPG